MTTLDSTKQDLRIFRFQGIARFESQLYSNELPKREALSQAVSWSRFMLTSEIQPAIEYAVGEKRMAGARFQRVCVLEHIRKNKWKAKWIDPGFRLH